jgi:two-component system, OmpR family, alkaline phosphatase synthesis response regulator PhoP
MDNLNIEIKQKILSLLKTKSFGASSSEIAKSIGHNRITVTKYLEIMKAHKLLTYEDVAQAKLWRISEKRNKPSILIVDDEPHVVDLVALSLISGQYNLIKAYSGLDALEKVHSETPDLIILDLMMPGINGYEICRRIKENALTQHIPIIILSAKGQLSDKLEGLKIGADDYITKPFDPMELEARVNVMLRRIKQVFDTHPLTNLPGIEALKSELKKRISSGKAFVVFNYNLENIEHYKKEYGYKKGDDLILILSRMLADIIRENQNSFIVHTLKDDFVIVASSADIEKDIKLAYKKILPYIYCDKTPKKEIELKQKKLSSQSIQSKSMDIDEIIKALGINMR